MAEGGRRKTPVMTPQGRGGGGGCTEARCIGIQVASCRQSAMWSNTTVWQETPSNGAMPMLLIALWGEIHPRKLTTHVFHSKRRKLLLIEMAGALLVCVSIACSNVQPLHVH